MDTTRGSLREQKKRHMYLATAQAAVKLIAEHGMRAVRVEDICEHADISRSTFFRYFDSKEACFFAGLHHGWFDAVLAALEARPAKEDPFTALCNAFIDTTTDWHRYREAMRLEARIRAEVPAVRILANAEQLTWERELATALEGRCFGADDRVLTARLTAGTVLCATRLAIKRWLEEGAVRSPAEYYTAAFTALSTLFEHD